MIIMITIVDYGMGNLGSIVHTLRRMDISAKISSQPADIQSAEKIILPGIGSYDKGMENLNRLKLIPVLEEQVLENKIPILGICLGMQLFSNRSEEGNEKGLGWIDSETIRFRFPPADRMLKIPHMGWNRIDTQNESILRDITKEDRFYFVHSYHIANIDEKYSIGTTKYGYEFVSVMQKENIIGIQCHPERSHKSGIKILQNFVRL